MAAQGYYRLTNRLAAVNVTAGPGATNAITGVFGAWTDSLGMVVVSGQVKWETLVRSTALPLRQLGDQEVDIVRLVEPITKYAALVDDPARMRYHLERAIHLARTGRPGPVWLDVPSNVQAAMVDPAALEGFSPEPGDWTGTDVPAACAEIVRGLGRAERPVVLAGAGVRLAGAAETFALLAERLGIPVVTGFNAHDLLPTDHPAYVGRQGTIGDRAGNFAVQNADFVLILGCRLNIRQVSYAWQHFARDAIQGDGRRGCGRAGRSRRSRSTCPCTPTRGVLLAGAAASRRRWRQPRARTSAGSRGAASGRRAIPWCCPSTGRRRGW